MTLNKIQNINVVPGKPGVPGVPGVPGREGYWSYRQVKTTKIHPEVQPVSPVPTNPPGTPTPGGGSGPQPEPPSGLSDGQYIRKCTNGELYYYFTTLRPLFDAIELNYNHDYDLAELGTDEQIQFQADWDAYKAEVTRLLKVEINKGVIGGVMTVVSHTYGPDAYIGAWDNGIGVWFFVFMGFEPDERPTMLIVPN